MGQELDEHGYSGQSRGSVLAFGTKGEVITPSDDNPIRRYKCVFCTTGGDIAMMDSAGNALPVMTFVAKEVIPFVPTYVLATGTTGTFYGVIE